MKCPKCSFISFDYNQTCPKCGNDLTHEKELLNLPSYKPSSLSLLGALTGASNIPDDETTMIEQSEILEEQAEGAEELLISLDNLSDDEPELIQFKPEPAPTEPEPEMEIGMDETVEDLSIPLDDLSDDQPELIQFKPEPGPTEPEPEMKAGTGEAVEDLSISLDDLSDDQPEFIQFEPELDLTDPETEIEDEFVFEPDLQISEEGEPERDALWETQAIEERMSDMQLDDTPENQGTPFDSGEEAPVKAKEMEPLLELELEPLELDIEMEESDKKTS